MSTTPTVTRYRVAEGRIVTPHLQPRKDGMFKAIDDATSAALRYRTIVPGRLFSETPAEAIAVAKASADAHLVRLRTDIIAAEVYRALLDTLTGA